MESSGRGGAHPSSVLVLGFSALVLGACASTAAGGQTGEETLGCLEVHTRALTPSELSPLGFSAEQAFAHVCGVHSALLRTADGAETPLGIGVACDDASTRFVDREWRDDREPVLASTCPDIVERRATLEFETDDGSFRESWPVALQAERADFTTAHAFLNLSTLNGTYQVTAVDPSAHEQLSAFLTIRFEADGVSGVIDGQASSRPSGDTASAQNFPIATFE